MSSIYATFAPTRGKVLVRTSFGDLDIELWPDQSPRAVRGFVLNCMSGRYNGSKFHRIIDEFIAQAGDVPGAAP
jgi:peptidyl-prolyl cis-trans isomerase SDCCAG10